VTELELKKAAVELAKIYRLTDENPRAIDPNEKERLYELSSRFPQIHYIALRINSSCARSG
jgi:hypothetical protein